MTIPENEMQNPSAMNSRAAAGRYPYLAHDLDHPLFRVAAMDHDWQIDFVRQHQMRAQRRFLRVARRVHVMEIETALSNRDNFFRRGELA